MTTPVFQAPVGLLDLLGTKSLGQNPNELSPVVQGNVDLLAFWLCGIPLQVRTVTSGVIVVPGIGGFGFTVPDGKIWVVQSIAAIAISAGSGDQGRVRPAIAGGAGNSTIVWSAEASAALTSGFATTTPCQAMHTQGSPVIALPGQLLTAFIEQVLVTTTGINCQLDVAYRELQI